MRSNLSGKPNDKLETLRKKEAALKEAIALEKIRQQKRLEKERARLASAIGECVLADLETNPQLRQFLEESLKRNANPHVAELLRARGWRI
jgi:pantoate kinase